MGIPLFFRWISSKYPSIISNCSETRCENSFDDEFESSISNRSEIHNLYLDMNGIIHPCCNPNVGRRPINQEEMFDNIAKYVDRLIRIVRPKNLIYFAIDGVAPRAKMNQQRSRRFRASRDRLISEKAIESLREIVRNKGYNLPDPVEREKFDSNCITPGTKFMADLSEFLEKYILKSQQDNIFFKNVSIILSDSTIPGEGEHKIMDFIRKQQMVESYNKDLVHCIYGADADLMVLGLCTHEENVIIIREEFRPTSILYEVCPLCDSCGHKPEECRGIDDDEKSTNIETVVPDVEFIFIRIYILREYLRLEFNFHAVNREIDFERCIDDWVLICFLVGNDFLPNLPSLDIREGAINKLMYIYKSRILQMDGYLSENGLINLENLKLILYDIGKMEDNIFQNRANRDRMYRERRIMEENESRDLSKAWQRDKLDDNKEDDKNNYTSVGKKRKIDSEEKVSNVEIPDDDPIKLGTSGWRFRYYNIKFKANENDIDDVRKAVATEYLKGINWVLKYYYQGCASWDWYFPYHYAPFASDCMLVDSLDLSFDKSEPIKPFDQLMSILPSTSLNLLPKPYHFLMFDKNSPIIDFYPLSFKVDLNGKRQEWQGVTLLPFIDLQRLRRHTKYVVGLTDDEKKLNSFGECKLFIDTNNPIYKLVDDKIDEISSTSEYIEIDHTQDAVTLFGLVSPINDDHKILYYRNPSYPPGTVFKYKNDSKLPRPYLKFRSDIYGASYEQNSSFMRLPENSHRRIRRSLPDIAPSNDNYSGRGYVDERQRYSSSFYPVPQSSQIRQDYYSTPPTRYGYYSSPQQSRFNYQTPPSRYNCQLPQTRHGYQPIPPRQNYQSPQSRYNYPPIPPRLNYQFRYSEESVLSRYSDDRNDLSKRPPLPPNDYYTRDGDQPSYKNIKK